MSNFFFGLTLNTQALAAEQNYFASPGKPSPEPQQLGASIATGRFDAGVDPVALNPQPLPPAESEFNRDFIASLPASFLDTVALNPQPLPPAEIADAPSLAALNPQPLPPAEIGAAALAWVALNPQPLPPAEIDRDALSPIARQPLALEDEQDGGFARRRLAQEDEQDGGWSSLLASQQQLVAPPEDEMFNLQAQLSTRQQVLQAQTNLVEAFDRVAQSIASNVGG